MMGKVQREKLRHGICFEIYSWEGRTADNKMNDYPTSNS